MGKSSPDPLVIDYDLLRTAPKELNIAGVGDLLSIHTATFDWELAQRAGRSEYPFATSDVRAAREALERVLSAASEIRSCSNRGLQAIVDGYLKVNTICLPAGHYRVEEGSEHYLFYALEERLGRPFVHGHIIALGVLLMARLQENQPGSIMEKLEVLGLPYQPRQMDLSRSALEQALRGLSKYVRGRPDLWYTVLNENEIHGQWIGRALADLSFL